MHVVYSQSAGGAIIAILFASVETTQLQNGCATWLVGCCSFSAFVSSVRDHLRLYHG